MKSSFLSIMVLS